MAQWFVSAKKADFYAQAKRFSITPMLARIIRNRDVVGDEAVDQFLHADLTDLYPPESMQDMHKAALFLCDQIKEQKKIRIIGDYDIDGVCAAYILKRGLLYCGACVDTTIPHRIKDGYGINEALILEASRSGIDTIITCDNGIAAYEQIAYANTLGMRVVVTDHHEVPFTLHNGEREEKLPPAEAVIDPKRSDCTYPYQQVCGAVVAYKLIQHMLTCRKLSDEILSELLEFAAIATVGDVMELLDENRIFVKYGLRAIHDTRNLGLRALLRVTGLEDKPLTPYHIGFVLGPCLNASGRLESAQRVLELFEAEDEKEAAVIAGDLKAINESRKEMTAQGVEKAVRQVEETPVHTDKILVIYLPECHESLAGIIAGRIREKYGKPVFVITKGEEGLKGSGRSIEAFSMYEEMAKHKELFTKFGGHKMAAGFSLADDTPEIFRKAMNEGCTLTQEDFTEKLLIDIPMPPAYATMELVKELSMLEPFGNGNPKPLFAQKNMHFLSGKILGQNQNVGKYVVEDEEKNRYETIYFGDIAGLNQYLEEHYGIEQKKALYQGKAQDIVLAMAYYPEINEFRGNQTLQLVMKHYQ